MSDTIYGKQLYRIPSKGKVFGVCAGVAEYFGWETWKVRLVTLVAAFFTVFTFVCIIYLMVFFILDPVPQDVAETVSQPKRSNRFNDRLDEVKRSFHQESKPSYHSIAELKKQFKTLQARVESVEAYVTSGRYQLEREFKTMSDE